jgi:transposase
MKPISSDIRELIVAAKERGEKEKSIAQWLGVSKSSVQKIWKLHRETGNILPIPYPGRTSRLSEEQFKEIDAFVEKYPDKTLEEITEELKLPIKKSRLSVILNGMDYNFKKRRSTQKSS